MHRVIAPRLGGALLLAAALLTAGCVDSGVRSDESVSAEEQAARSYLAEGRPIDAAAAYLSLADRSFGNRASRYRLDAAAAYLAAGEVERARVQVGAVKRDDSAIGLRHRLVSAEIALADGTPARVLEILPEPRFNEASRPLQAHAGELRARAYEALGNPIESARQRVRMELVLDDPAGIEANREDLWATLVAAPAQALDGAYLPPPDTLGGWIELAGIDATAASGDLGPRVEAWRSRYPGHPAGPRIVARVLETSAGQMAGMPAKVALLLPLSGAFEEAASSVRDGFMAAWYAAAGTESRPSIEVRDTVDADLPALYGELAEAGVGLVVGPLRKPAVSSLASLESHPVPILALNETELDAQARPASMLTFSLSPEEEARRAAEFAWSEGHSRAGMLTPLGPWGERVGAAFASRWREQGGTLAAQTSYIDESPDMSDPVSELLKLGGYVPVRRRAPAVGSVLPATGMDVVFVAAFPRQGRQIKPQFDYYDATELPLVSTSHVYAGNPNPKVDRDLEGIAFGDMPWVVEPASADLALRAAVDAQWPLRAQAYARLFAFGADAYRLIPRIAALRRRPDAQYAGLTGTLSIDPQGRVHRRLTWTRFVDGVPRGDTDAQTTGLGTLQ